MCNNFQVYTTIQYETWQQSWKIIARQPDIESAISKTSYKKFLIVSDVRLTFF